MLHVRCCTFVLLLFKDSLSKEFSFKAVAVHEVCTHRDIWWAQDKPMSDETSCARSFLSKLTSSNREGFSAIPIPKGPNLEKKSNLSRQDFA